MLIRLAVSVGAALLLVSIGAPAFAGQQMEKDAVMGIAQARAAALRAHPGKLMDEELEKEPGGSGLRYSFDIRNGKDTQGFCRAKAIM